ncbi:MAG TPA: VOC family protein [Vicinamibacterales bacterium]|nr:VOC family protein [Vicinamibacterales bacterium]
MNQLHPAARIGAVHLTVSDLSRSVAFYGEHVGFIEAWRRDDTAGLAAGDRVLLVLHGSPDAPRPPHTTGLYHFAILVPSRLDLARSLRHFADMGTRMQGFSDHAVSEALYLADPDGNGIEVYRDRPRDEWRRVNGQIQMTLDPLDVESLLRDADEETQKADGPAWKGLVPGTTMGHMHLRVSFVEDSEEFYRDVLGLDLILRYAESASFLSAGGYHHHIAVNVWGGVGAPRPPEGAIGLRHFEILLPDAAAVDDVARRITAAGIAADITSGRVAVRDPSGNAIVISVQP